MERSPRRAAQSIAEREKRKRALPRPRHLYFEVENGTAGIDLECSEPEARAAINRIFGTVNDGFADGMAAHLTSLIATANGSTEKYDAGLAADL